MNPRGKAQPLLLIGASVRLLAQSGHRAGLSLWAVDRFLDEDTLKVVEGGIRLTGADAFDSAAVLRAVRALDPDEQMALVYAGGLENHPDLLTALCRRRPLLGNAPTLLRRLREENRFFRLLDDLRIPHPRVTQERPDSAGTWLLKSACSEGGKGVRFAENEAQGAGDYYQQYIEGPVCSVLFLSNGSDFRLIGFNTLWSISCPRRPFLFAGAANFTVCSDMTLKKVSDWLPRLVHATGLVGLNSLDFVVDKAGQPLALEINPRPSATIGLYDAETPGGLLRQHLEAVRGQALQAIPASPHRAFHVMLTPAPLKVSTIRHWPEWCHDRPGAGTHMIQGDAFCTVEATGRTGPETLRRLNRRRMILRARLESARSRLAH